MASLKIVALPWRPIDQVNGTDVWIPATGWSKAGGLGSCRATVEMRGRVGSPILAVPAFQLANDPLLPDAAVAILVQVGGSTGYANGDSMFYCGAFASMPTSDRRLVRYGWLVKLASGTNGSAQVQAEIEVLY